MIQRSAHIWEAEIDGKPAEIVTANLYRMGLEVPAGRHRVILRIDRSGLTRSSFAVALGLALLPGLAWWGGRRSAVRYPPS